MSFWPSLVSKFSLNPSTASAFTLATTLFFAVDLADLYSALSFSNPDCFHFFSRSFFSLTAFSSTTFQRQLSSHHFRLICHTLPRYFPQYTRQLHSTIYPPCHHMFHLVLIVSPLPFYISPPTHSRILNSTILSISFLLVLSFLYTHFRHQYLLRVMRLLLLMDVIIGAYLIVFAFPSTFFPSQQFHVIYLGFISTTYICYRVVCSFLEDCVQYPELICRCYSAPLSLPHLPVRFHDFHAVLIFCSILSDTSIHISRDKQSLTPQ